MEELEVIELIPGVVVPSYFTGILKSQDGTITYQKDGKIHRSDGPAVIFPDGSKAWVLDGIPVSPSEVFEKMTEAEKMKVLWDLNNWK